MVEINIIKNYENQRKIKSKEYALDLLKNTKEKYEEMRGFYQEVRSFLSEPKRINLLESILFDLCKYNQDEESINRLQYEEFVESMHFKNKAQADLQKISILDIFAQEEALEKMALHITQRVNKKSQLRSICRNVQIKDGIGSIEFCTEDEDEIPEIKNFPFNKMYMIINSENMQFFEKISKSNFELYNNFLEHITDNIIKIEDEAFLLGDGKNKPLGVMNDTEVPFIISEKSYTICLNDLIEAIKKISNKKDIVFLMNKNSLVHLRDIKDHSGNYILKVNDSLDNIFTLLGSKVIFSDAMPTNRFKDGIEILCGNFNNSFMAYQSTMIKSVTPSDFIISKEEAIGYLDPTAFCKIVGTRII